MKKICKVKFSNARAQAVRLNDCRGNQLHLLRPGEAFQADVVSELSLYWGYSSILFKPEGVEYSFAEGFEPPEPSIMILNVDGPEYVWRRVGGAEVLAQRNLPRFVKLSADDPLRQFQRMIIRRQVEPQKSERVKGFYEFKERLADVFE